MAVWMGNTRVLVELADKSGNLYTVDHLIVYDTQAPTLDEYSAS